MGLAIVPIAEAVGAAAEGTGGGATVTSIALVGVEGDIVQAIAAKRKSTAPSAGSHIGVLGSGRGSL